MEKPFIYETSKQPLAKPPAFRARLIANGVIALGIIAVALAVGMAGYAWFEDMSAIDAFANSAMILSGMGPLTPLATFGGKLFAGLYAIICGLLIFAVAGLVLAPVFHRILHRFHVQDGTK